MPLDLPLYRIHKLDDFFPRWLSAESSHLLPPDRPCTQKGNQKGIPKQLNFYSVCSHSMSNLIKYKNFLEMVDQWAVESKKVQKFATILNRAYESRQTVQQSVQACTPDCPRRRGKERSRPSALALGHTQKDRPNTAGQCTKVCTKICTKASINGSIQYALGHTQKYRPNTAGQCTTVCTKICTVQYGGGYGNLENQLSNQSINQLKMRRIVCLRFLHGCLECNGNANLFCFLKSLSINQSINLKGDTLCV